MDLALVIITIILINTLISLILFNINAKQQYEINTEQKEFNTKVVETVGDILRDKIEIQAKIHNLENNKFKKKAGNKNETRQKNNKSNRL